MKTKILLIALTLTLNSFGAVPKLNLTWDPVGPADSFTVYRGKESRGYTVGVPCATNLYKLDTGALELITNRWYFAVTATLNGIESDFSAEFVIGGYFPKTNFVVEVGLHDGVKQLTNIAALSITNPVGNGFFMSRISAGPPGMASLDLLKETESGWQRVTNFLLTIVATNKSPTINIK